MDRVAYHSVHTCTRQPTYSAKWVLAHTKEHKQNKRTTSGAHEGTHNTANKNLNTFHFLLRRSKTLGSKGKLVHLINDTFFHNSTRLDILFFGPKLSGVPPCRI